MRWVDTQGETSLSRAQARNTVRPQDVRTMTRVTLHGHGVYCHACDEVYDSTDECDHRLDRKSGIHKERDYYIAQPAEMGHYSPHHWMEIDGIPQCPECGAVRLSKERVEE